MSHMLNINRASDILTARGGKRKHVNECSDTMAMTRGC